MLVKSLIALTDTSGSYSWNVKLTARAWAASLPVHREAAGPVDTWVCARPPRGWFFGNKELKDGTPTQVRTTSPPKRRWRAQKRPRPTWIPRSSIWQTRAALSSSWRTARARLTPSVYSRSWRRLCTHDHEGVCILTITKAPVILQPLPRSIGLTEKDPDGCASRRLGAQRKWGGPLPTGLGGINPWVRYLACIKQVEWVP